MRRARAPRDVELRRRERGEQLAAELRVNGLAAVALHDATAHTLRLAAAARGPGGAARARAASEVAGLSATTLLSLPANASLAVVVDHALPRTRAFLGLRKL